MSGSAAIIFIGLLVATGIAVPPLIGSFGSLAGAQGQQVDRGIDALNTEFGVWRVTYDSTDDRLALELNNTGSTTLSINETNVLLDGVIPTPQNVTTDIAGDGATDLWLPGETLDITVANVDTKPTRVKIVTENGVARTENEITEI
ncbi:MAG: fla cluster protein FlaF [Natronomonas sp.]|uniref:fla cluster protein FlaF n=1 Tax=Natronomonas sp. TaxID=2184060 RepID=UPI00287008FC|nr:fla cluster protein FlaF [Natronomonas sp.]MDR9430500.1 fla cluster protein FlaF [Natronomonas sp.]